MKIKEQERLRKEIDLSGAFIRMGPHEKAVQEKHGAE
jgi:hypothetical protein